MRPPSSIPTDRPHAVAVVPARLGSTRLPRKMLADVVGLPLVVRTARNAARATALAGVVVATDSEEVRAAAAAHGVEALLTSPDHASGTDRVHEAYVALAAGGRPAEVVVDVQGDEPELPPEHLELLVDAFRDHAVDVATLCAPLEDEGDWRDPAVVKVVRDAAGDALYFSRAPIPSHDHARAEARDARPLAWRHVGVYAFRPDALARFCALSAGALERRENLEQLRWLEAGHKMRCLVVDRVAPGVDTPEQLERLRRALAPGGECAAP